MDDLCLAGPAGAAVECRPCVVYYDARGLQFRRQVAKKKGSVTLGRDRRGCLSIWARLDEVCWAD